MAELIYPENFQRKRIVKFAMATVIVLCILAPFMTGTYKRIFVKPIMYEINDDFIPCYTDECINGGVDTSVWSFEIGDGSQYSQNQRGWGNNELQCYSDKYHNIHVRPNPDKKDDGMLVISAIYDANTTSCQWTSARLTSVLKRSIAAKKDRYATYCVSAIIEARMKIPLVGGAHSAFWMLPEPPRNRKNCLGCGVYGDWCNSGELDIMEHRDIEDKVIGNVRFNNTYECDNHPATSNALKLDDWHVYKLHWSCEDIKWYVDDVMYKHYKPIKTMKPFDQPFHVILNHAVGGDFSNYKQPDIKNSTMYVDWVRAYYK